MDEFYKPELSATEDAIMSKLQEQIHYCLNCQPRDSGEWIWIYGERHDLEDLLDEYELSEEQKDNVVSHLICPFCGTPLCRGDEIGLKGIDDYEYENNYLNTILDDKDFYNSFCEEISKIKQLLNIEIKDIAIKSTLFRQIFISQITILETYLSDALINTVLSENKYIRKFVKTFKDFNNEKIDLSNIFDEIDNIETKVKKSLLDILYHNLAKVKGVFKATLEVDFPNISYLSKNISIRHDLVHRNGKTKEGEDIIVNEEMLKDNFEIIEDFVKKINEQLVELDKEDEELMF